MKLLKINLLIVACSLVPCLVAEPYRPVYHHTPEQNWMNDPNGMFFDDSSGIWHLYYQHNPYATTWGNMSWAHSTSIDLIHWEHQPLAILPDTLGTIFSGSAVIDKENTAGFGAGAVVAIFTYSERKGQMQAIAYSTDGGYSFIKYEANPVLTANEKDFRDPKVWRDEDGWKMVLAVGQEVRFYHSDNLKAWTYLSSFGKGYGCHDGVWECPDMIRFADKDVLIVNINPGGLHGGSATQYFVGNWDGTTFTIDPTQNTDTYWMDYGKDHYATVSFHNAPDNRHVVLAWMSNWQYAEVVPTENFRSQNSLARDIELVQKKDGSYRLHVVPSPEYTQLDIPSCCVKYKGKPIQQYLDTKEMVGHVTIYISHVKHPVKLVFKNKLGEQVTLNCDSKQGIFSMDRTYSGLTDFHRDFPAITTAPISPLKDTDIDIYIDRNSMEICLNHGEAVMTNLIFPTQPYDELIIQ